MASIELHKKGEVAQTNKGSVAAAIGGAMRTAARPAVQLFRKARTSHSDALKREVMKDPLPANKLGEHVEGRNTLYIHRGTFKAYLPDDGPTDYAVLHYKRQQTLADGRVMRIGVTRYASWPDGLAVMDIRISPSEDNPIGFETHQHCDNPVDTLRVYNGSDRWMHLHVDSYGAIDPSAGLVDMGNHAKGMSVLSNMVTLSEGDVSSIKDAYSTLVKQALEVLQGKRDNITLVPNVRERVPELEGASRVALRW